ncbi:MAG: DHH family phosphoesterase [Methanomassiliicoccus sp.]|nr:DHH family phosphoesterase [Methanomassiliicoccus sp.]
MTARDEYGFESAAAAAAGMLISSRSVLVVGHIDADGITASAIASTALTRAGIPHEVCSVKKLDETEIARSMEHRAERIWFVDLGSGSLSKLDRERCVITDHHRVDPTAAGEWRGHVNPHLFGIDGSTEISGAGVTYVVAKRMDARNADLSALAVVGAVGDYQEAAEGRLVGYNRAILGDATALRLIAAEKDVRLFGRQTRPVHALLQYSSEPSLMPFIAGGGGRSEATPVDSAEDEDDKMATIDFLEELGIAIDQGDTFRTWSQLSFEEKRTIVSALVARMIDQGKGLPMVRRLIGEVYTLSPDIPGAPPGWLVGPEGTAKGGNGCTWRPSARVLLDAKEFSTLLNACGRHERAEVGMKVCLGNRGEALGTALLQQDDHRRKLREAIDLVKTSPEHGARTVTPRGVELKAVRYFHGGMEIEDTIVGIVTGMLLGSPDFPHDRPLIAFAQAGDGSCTVKVSGRGTRDLTRRGLDLSSAMRTASERVGGTGGGHNIAAGATVPEGREEEFLLAIDLEISSQLSP